jgi:hypothetical protein
MFACPHASLTKFAGTGVVATSRGRWNCWLRLPEVPDPGEGEARDPDCGELGSGDPVPGVGEGGVGVAPVDPSGGVGGVGWSLASGAALWVGSIRNARTTMRSRTGTSPWTGCIVIRCRYSLSGTPDTTRTDVILAMSPGSGSGQREKTVAMAVASAPADRIDFVTRFHHG